MIEVLKEKLDNKNIEFKEVTKEDLMLQVGMENVAYVIHLDKGEKAVSYIGQALNGKYGKAAIPLHTVNINTLEDGLDLDGFKDGGTLIMHSQVGEGFLVGNLYKKVKN